MITHLTRYPVKGLSGEALPRMTLLAGEGIVGDRSLAIARSPDVFDPDTPKASSKLNFLMLAKDEALARLTTRYDPVSHILVIEEGGVGRLGESTQTAEGRARITDFFRAYLGHQLNLEIVSAPGHKFTDISVVSAEKMRAISLVNLASVRALEEAIGKPVDPRRFRANICFDGIPSWDELNWVDRSVRIGEAKARVVMRTKRCPATEVNPETGARDIQLPFELRKHFGHFDMGIYAEVEESGEVAIGDDLHVI